jgi:isopenicillin N synthase-like dioxygenase
MFNVLRRRLRIPLSTTAAIRIRHLSRPLISLPIVDLKNEVQASAALNEAFSKYGCCYLTGHDIDLKNEKKVLKAAQAYFSMSNEDKKKNERPKSSNGFIRGYIGLGGESGSEELIEVKEAFSYGYEWNQQKRTSNPLQGPNVWPKTVNFELQHQECLQNFFTKLVVLIECFVMS